MTDNDDGVVRLPDECITVTPIRGGLKIAYLQAPDGTDLIVLMVDDRKVGTMRTLLTVDGGLLVATAITETIEATRRPARRVAEQRAGRMTDPQHPAQSPEIDPAALEDEAMADDDTDDEGQSDEHPFDQTDYDALVAEVVAEVEGEDHDDDEPQDDTEPSNREARYRQRARDAEAEVQRLNDLVEGMQRAEIQRLATDVLADPADLWRDDAELADVLDDAGRVDAAKLNAVVDKLLTDHPHWRKPLAPFRGPLHSGVVNTRTVDVPADGFKSAFGPKAG